jgi:hypothetical protein
MTSDLFPLLLLSIELIYKSEAMVFDKKHISTLTRRVREVQESVVLIWLGTCEITQNKGKYIKSLDYPYLLSLTLFMTSDLFPLLLLSIEWCLFALDME